MKETDMMRAMLEADNRLRARRDLLALDDFLREQAKWEREATEGMGPAPEAEGVVLCDRCNLGACECIPF